ncbi:Bacterial regulatory protein, arsR family [uncultured archaeon]|nr:Bacterial regulatory protein, arsR family [uncultured archaeon]
MLKLNIALLCVLLLFSLAFASCATTVHVGDSLVAQGYTVKLNSIGTDENGSAAGSISASLGGFTMWEGKISNQGSYSFSNPLDNSEITITSCQVVPGANGYALVDITGINFTLVQAPSSQPLPEALPLPAKKNATANIVIFTNSSPDGQRISLPLGQTVPAGGYNLRLVGSPAGGTAQVEVSDSAGRLIGTYDVGTGSSVDVPSSQGAAAAYGTGAPMDLSSPLKFTLTSISGAEGGAGATENAAAGAASTIAGAQGAGQPSAAAAPEGKQQASNVSSLITILVLFIGMIVASFIVLHYVRQQTVQIEDPTMKLLANETRAGIVRQLAEADRIPTDLALQLDKSKAAISEHLDILVGEGLVERIEEPGRKFVFYRLTQKGKQVLLRMAG